VNVCHKPSLLADCAAIPLEANDGFVFLFAGQKLEKHWSKKTTHRKRFLAINELRDVRSFTQFRLHGRTL
jgi:hypothetical protein